MQNDLRKRPRIRGAARLKHFRAMMSRLTPADGAFRQPRMRAGTRLARFLNIERRSV